MGFLSLPFPDDRCIHDHLPNVRFVFPTASYRRAQTFDRIKITQWFDIHSWDSTEHAERQIEGLKETSAWVHELIHREIDIVGARNVVLGGLSQGCASSLIALLLWNGEPIKAVFGMSGWLPFKHVLELAKSTSLDADGRILFEGDETEKDPASLKTRTPYATALKMLRDEFGLSSEETNTVNTVPIFITHGGQDETVDVELGREAANCLRQLGLNVKYQEYPTLTHWMRGDELSDIVDFVASLDSGL